MKTVIVKTATLTALVSSLTLLSVSATVYADDTTAPAAAPAAPAGPALPSFPSLGGVLTANPKPFSFEAGPVGNVFVTGVVSAIAQAQSNPLAGVANSQADISNAQVFINKTDGLIQFSGQFGSYSLPDLGAPYVKAEKATPENFGVFSQGYIKLVPSDSFNVMVGKLPTLIGDEYSFSFENMNIQRGLLWGQEPAVSRGVQANYTTGPLALSLSFNDGYYSNKYNTVSGSATYTVDSANTLAFSGSGHTGGFTNAPLSIYQDNGQIYNLLYTHTSGPWTFQPYLQYNYVPQLNALGTKSASSTGAAVLASYKVNDNISLPVRLEYIASTGSTNDPNDPNLLYGAGSKAWSLTITPTYQYKIFFVRGELSVVGISDGDKADGLEFGKNGDKTTQVAGLLETGIMF